MSASETPAGAAGGAEGSSGVKETSPRCRRQTVFYSPETPAQKQTFRVPQGTGHRLRDIPSIWDAVAKMRADDALLIDVHRILYKRAGVKTKRKRSVGDFCGFKFKSDEKEMETEKLRERIAHVRGLRKLVEFFDLPVKSGKEEMMDAIVSFLMKPKEVTHDEEPEPSVPKKETPTTKKAVKKLTVSRKRKSRDGKSKAEASTKRSSTSSSMKRKKKELTKTDEDAKKSDEQQEEDSDNNDEGEQQGSTEAPDADETAPASEEHEKQKLSSGDK